MQIDLEIKNYRCFPDNRPVRFSLGDRFASFVGINNAGKSSILRFFFEFRQALSHWTSPTGNQITMLTNGAQGIELQGVADQAEVFNDSNDRGVRLKLSIQPDERGQGGLPVPSALLLDIPRNRQMTAVVELAGEEIPRVNLDWHESLLRHEGNPICEFALYFDALGQLTRSLYVPSFRNAINIGAQANYYDLQVGQAFIVQWDQFKAGPDKSANRAALELTEDIRRIFGFRSLEINASQDNQTLQVIIDGRSYRLHELGGGLAHFIIVLAYVATRRPPYVFIDEPELNLHPALQLDFLATLGTYSTRAVVFSTHSLGLARAASEVVYSVRRVAQAESEVREYEATPRLSEFLGELSFAGYQELGFEKVMLVEGPTDVLAIQRLLRLYGVEHKVVLVPLGGRGMIRAETEGQLSEVKRITDHVYALIDSERTAGNEALSADRAGFVEVCERLGISCHVLERRALENYFTERAVQAVKGETFSALDPYQRLSELDTAWGKSENWRIAGELRRNEVNGTDLGNFLRSLSA